MMSALPLASARLSSPVCLHDPLYKDLCKHFFYFHIFYFFLVSNMILSDALILPVSQSQTQQVMTSQIRSNRIFNTDLLYSCGHFVLEIDEKSSLNGALIRFNDDS